MVRSNPYLILVKGKGHNATKCHDELKLKTNLFFVFNKTKMTDE